MLSRRIHHLFNHNCSILAPIFRGQTKHARFASSNRSDRYQRNDDSTYFEITQGAGGQESMLFAREMLAIYTKIIKNRGWPHSILELDEDQGIRHVKLLIGSGDSYRYLVQEAGVHRVQRVPKTEKYGRMQTSTIAVSVVPKFVVDIELKEKDLEITAKRASGAGGQFVNKTDSAIRIVHKPTGIAVESQEERQQSMNKKNAMEKLRSKLQQIELDKITSKMTGLRQSQVGQAERNEKIRTYNFPADRITDHRLNKSFYNLRGLFEGDVGVMEKIINEFHR